jgi:outer membrane translocation and assembly module TamA
MATRRITPRVIALLIALLATNAAAQSTRVEAIAGEQAAKAKQTEPEGASEAEKVVRQILASPLLTGGDGVYPWFGSVYSGTGMAVGVGYLKRLENAANVNLQTGISLNNSLMVRGGIAAPELWRGMLRVDASGQWIDARGVSFYGYGQDSDKATRERFDYSPIDVTLNATLKPARRLSLVSTYSFLAFTTQREVPIFSEAQAPGLDQDLSYHLIRGTAVFDWRPAFGYSTRGGFLRATLENYAETKNRPYSFRSQEYEVAQQVPLVKEQFVLAARALMTLTTTDQGDAVPVILSPFLGSGSTLRGYANRRFTDRNRVLLTGEYRWRPSRYLDMALFIDAGQVAADRNDFDPGQFDMAWGIGARFHGPTFNALRFDVARGREGIRFVVTGSQPF